MIPDFFFSLSPLTPYSVFPHLRGDRCRTLLCRCLSTAKVSPVRLMDPPGSHQSPPPDPTDPSRAERSWILLPGCQRLEAECGRDPADNGRFVPSLDVLKLQLLWTRRRLVKQTHTKALEMAGRGPFSSVCRTANIRHLPRPQ